MDISYDPEKRALILAERGLDFYDATEVFAGTALTVEDDRKDYGEKRYQTMGPLKGGIIVIIWTPRGASRHIITMWKANDRERKRYEAQFE